jgi:hypothetical protein
MNDTNRLNPEQRCFLDRRVALDTAVRRLTTPQADKVASSRQQPPFFGRFLASLKSAQIGYIVCLLTDKYRE